MSQAIDTSSVVVRPDLRRMVAMHAALALILVAFAGVAVWSQALDDRAIWSWRSWVSQVWTWPIAATAWFSLLPLAIAAVLLGRLPFVLRDQTPRLIVAFDGIRWREGRDGPLYFLPWTRIASASVQSYGEDGEALRLILGEPAVEERGAADWPVSAPVDIDLDNLDIETRDLKAEIHRRAPHLFAPAARRGR